MHILRVDSFSFSYTCGDVQKIYGQQHRFTMPQNEHKCQLNSHVHQPLTQYNFCTTATGQTEVDWLL